MRCHRLRHVPRATTVVTLVGLVVMLCGVATTPTWAQYSVTLSPNPLDIVMYASAEMTVTLDAPAEVGGALVELFCSGVDLAVPAYVVVMLSETSAAFMVTAGGAEGSGILTAVCFGGSDVAEVNVLLPTSAPIRTEHAADDIRFEWIGLPGTSSTFRLTVPEAAWAELTVLDVAGHRVATPWSGAVPAGQRLVSWDGAGEHGRAAAAGVYFARVEVQLPDGRAARTVKVPRLR